MSPSTNHLKYPLNPYERGVFLEQKRNTDSLEYNLLFHYEISGTDLTLLRQSLELIFRSHEAFHSTYREENGQLFRILVDEIPEVQIVPIEDLKTGFTLSEAENRPLDLSSGIPVCVTIYTDGETHLLCLNLHHICYDGRSVQIFNEELLAALSGKHISASSFDLSDAALVDRSAEYERGLSHFKELFSDGVPVTELPLKGVRPQTHPLSDTNYEFTIASDTYDKIKVAAKSRGISPSALLFTAAAITLGKYTGKDDVVLGLPVDTRTADEKNTIGMYVNTVPIRVKPERTKELSVFLTEVSDAIAGSAKDNTCPFESLVSEFVKTRDASKSPIYDFSINYFHYREVCEQDGVRIKATYALQPSGKDINFVLRNDGRALHGFAQYSIELFDAETVARFVEQFLFTLHLIADGNAGTVRDAAVLPPAQQEKLERFSKSAEGEVPIKLLHKLFEKQAKETPDALALIACDGEFTFDALNRRMNAAAHNLMERGVKRGDSVVLLLPRRSDFFVCQFAVLKAGACYIPCDPEYPADRINHIITDSGASFLITTEAHTADYPAEKTIEVHEILKENDETNPDVPVSPDDLAYMIYTSGSTGKPKGVMLMHLGICNYVYPHKENRQFYLAKEITHRIVGVTTVSFDMMLKETVGFFLNGKTLVFADEEQMNDPRALAELMTKYEVDAINATPSRLAQYLDYAPFAEALKKCTMILSGGEAYPMSLLERLRNTTTAQIFNTYGPTEITVSSNGANLTNADAISIGPPLFNYREYIVDKFGDLTPPGVMGELYIGGPGVALGYRNLPGKTKEQFVDYRGARFYRSGDYAKWDNDGNVLILGRMDNQIKLRGLRIELDEIQGLIEKQPHIEKAVVTVRKLNGQDNLCAYFTADEKVDTEELKEELKKHLTHYMVPTAYLQLDAVPITPNGKTDLKALPEPVLSAGNEYAEPANDTERYFCELYRKILKLDKVGATDDFFEIGGTSLVATSVVIDASEKGFPISYGDVFQYTTPRALAEFVQGDAGRLDDSFLIDFDDYDYTAINAALSRNTLESFRVGELRPIGNILLTGPTGYMGAHVLAEFLRTESGKAFCMLRKGRFKTALERLKNMMFYYFDGKYDEEIESRVIAIEGDVTDYKHFEPLEKEPIDTVFNCAANVKHFSKGTDIEDVNVKGVQNCIVLCLKKNARLIHFSTISTAGMTQDYDSYFRTKLTEQMLYFGQTLNLKYTSSKLWSEREVLEAVAEKGLDGKVIRVGTLAAREEDGEFQINYLTNNFMGRLRSFVILGCFPYSIYGNRVCMGPIDTSARAFLLLAKTPSACCVYNAINNHSLPLGDIIRDMNDYGMKVDFVEDEQFADALAEAEKDPKKAAILSSMLAYSNLAHGGAVYQYEADCAYTTQILMRLGFFWNPSDKKYVNDFVKGLSGLGFFDDNNLVR